MNIVLRRLSAAALCMSLGSLGACATVTRGTKQEVTFESSPPGAVAKTTTGYICDSTPCTTKLPRKDSFDVTFTLAGFKPATVRVRSVDQGGGTVALLGNAVVGGVIGAAVDYTNGSLLDLAPNPVRATLEPVGNADAAPTAQPGAN